MAKQNANGLNEGQILAAGLSWVNMLEKRTADHNIELCIWHFHTGGLSHSIRLPIRVLYFDTTKQHTGSISFEGFVSRNGVKEQMHQFQFQRFMLSCVCTPCLPLASQLMS